MSVTLSSLQQSIKEELVLFEQKFKESMTSDVPLLDKITQYIIKRKGKQMRPMLVFYSAKIAGGVRDKSYFGASLIELLHTATLVHDDVVDESEKRRGFFSLNALWKNKISVLVGDFLLSKGLLLAIENDAVNLLKLTSIAVREMSEGELYQIEKTRFLNITEEEYFHIIRKKTASLIAASCAVGAASSGADEVMIEKFRLLGEKIGIAFQIKDDLLDFDDNHTDKPTGIDLKEKKLTLPVIFALNQSNFLTKVKVKRQIKHGKTSQDFLEIIQFIRKNGGIEYAEKIMHEYKQEAINILNSLPEHVAREDFKKLIEFTVNRKK